MAYLFFVIDFYIFVNEIFHVLFFYILCEGTTVLLPAENSLAEEGRTLRSLLVRYSAL